MLTFESTKSERIHIINPDAVAAVEGKTYEVEGEQPKCTLHLMNGLSFEIAGDADDVAKQIEAEKKRDF